MWRLMFQPRSPRSRSGISPVSAWTGLGRSSWISRGWSWSRARTARSESNPRRTGVRTSGGEEDVLVVVVMVLARSGEHLAGDAIRDALEAQGLSYGERQMFHRYAPGQPLGAPPMFSAVNAVAPGAFDLTAIGSLRTPGIALFLELPGPADGSDAFARMLDTARRLAKRLDAHLCDQSRSTLTQQAINHLQ